MAYRSVAMMRYERDTATVNKLDDWPAMAILPPGSDEIHENRFDVA